MIKIFSKFNFIKPKINLTSPKFNIATADGYVVHSDMQVKYKGGKASLSTICNGANGMFRTHSISTEITNPQGISMGHYDYSIDPRENTISNGLIVTKPLFRDKGLAEIMRLSSIMELEENCIESIKIESLSGAVPFHLKYKFVPDIKVKNTALGILGNIMDNPNVEKAYKKDANHLVAKIMKENKWGLLNQDCTNLVNKYILNFITKHIHNWDFAKFEYNLPMILTEERIEHFAKFYNSLFKKHGIDYTI